MLCYAAVLINFTYYTQYYAHVKGLCLGIKYFCYKLDCLLEYIYLYKLKMLTVLLEYIYFGITFLYLVFFIRINSVTVLLEYILLLRTFGINF